MILLVLLRVSISVLEVFCKNGTGFSIGMWNLPVMFTSSIILMIACKHRAGMGQSNVLRDPLGSQTTDFFAPNFIIESFLSWFCCAIKEHSSHD